MLRRYEGLAPQQANDLMASTIEAIVSEELLAVRNLTRDEWRERDIEHWANSIAGAIYCTVQNRLKEGP